MGERRFFHRHGCQAEPRPVCALAFDPGMVYRVNRKPSYRTTRQRLANRERVPMLRHLAVLMIVSGLWPAAAQSPADSQSVASPIDLVALKTPGLLDDVHPGPYNKTAAALLDGFVPGATLNIFPARRALRHFASEAGQCFFAANYDPVYFGSRGFAREHLDISAPFNTVRIRAFARPDATPVSSIEALREQRLAIDLAVGGERRIREKLFVPNKEAIEVTSASQAYALLMQGRVDAVLMMDYDYALHAARHPQDPRMVFDPAFQIERVEDAVLCKKSPAAAAFIAHVNERIAQLKADRRLADLLQPTGQPLPEKNSERGQ